MTTVDIHLQAASHPSFGLAWVACCRLQRLPGRLVTKTSTAPTTTPWWRQWSCTRASFAPSSLATSTCCRQAISSTARNGSNTRCQTTTRRRTARSGRLVPSCKSGCGSTRRPTKSWRCIRAARRLPKSRLGLQMPETAALLQMKWPEYQSFHWGLGSLSHGDTAKDLWRTGLPGSKVAPS